MENLYIRRLAGQVLWAINRDLLPNLVRDRVTAFENQPEILQFIELTEWLSAIIVDDWNGPKMLNQIYEEIAQKPFPMLTTDSHCRAIWDKFCNEIARKTDKPVQFGKGEDDFRGDDLLSLKILAENMGYPVKKKLFSKHFVICSG